MLRYWLCFASAVCLAGHCGANYCRDANLCCPGRDSACVVQKAHQNAIIEDLTDKPCYCDHACLKLGDCCPDFRETCGVIDCVVSGWGPWSDCDTNCGSGSMVRSRRVVQASAHGGRHCPSLVQRRACQEHRGCSEDSNVPLRDETAMILPGGLSVSRHSNDTVDIRKNLRLRNPDDPEANSHREYCAQFEVTKVSKACHTDSDYKSLREVIDCVVSGWGPWSDCDTNCGSGSMVRSRRVVQASAHGGRHCPSLVQRRACQEHRGCSEDSNVPLRDETAMILPGGLSVSRRSNDTVDIRKNLRLRNPDDPEANSHREYCAQFEVTKVSKACHTDSDYKSLREGNTVCVLCETAALRRDLKWRCSGHGVAGHATRFYALVAPHCHGKWVKAPQNPDKRSDCCANPDFIFV